ncbi:MAG: 1-acyl-sn-glycerol-3-phosphate acyltransferase [Oscillospiraceae bacterium]|nr:1-acyl-sn-glycerol-3-phosphate acyltransferase [Oscillospiraceae bacterium]
MPFFRNDIPVFAAVLFAAILLAAAVVLIVCFSRKNAGTPDSPVYRLIFLISRLLQGRSPRLIIEDKALSQAEAPYIMLANHESFFDFNYIHRMAHPRPPAFLINNYYCTRPVLKTLKRKSGMLAKKLFTSDFGAPVSIMRTLRSGYPVVIFPEGRLSPDGRSNPIVEEGAAFYRRLGVDLVLVKIHGAYYAGPKWRKRRYHADSCVRVSVERIIKRDELKTMQDAEINALITSTLYNDASVDPPCSYPRKDKAEGLEGLLYRCADCGELYSMHSKGNTLRCRACESIHTLDEEYRFTSEPFTIPAWYDHIRETERAELDRFHLDAAVRTVICPAAGGSSRKEKGECRLDAECFSYHSPGIDFSIPTEKLPALAFSCSKEFELYYNNEQYFFYPLEHPEQSARWALFVDLLSERRRNERELTCNKRKKRS